MSNIVRELQTETPKVQPEFAAETVERGVAASGASGACRKTRGRELGSNLWDQRACIFCDMYGIRASQTCVSTKCWKSQQD